jgi:hypothetical protein
MDDLHLIREQISRRCAGSYFSHPVVVELKLDPVNPLSFDEIARQLFQLAQREFDNMFPAPEPPAQPNPNAVFCPHLPTENCSTVLYEVNLRQCREYLFDFLHKTRAYHSVLFPEDEAKELCQNIIALVKQYGDADILDEDYEIPTPPQPSFLASIWNSIFATTEKKEDEKLEKHNSRSVRCYCNYARNLQFNDGGSYFFAAAVTQNTFDVCVVLVSRENAVMMVLIDED